MASRLTYCKSILFVCMIPPKIGAMPFSSTGFDPDLDSLCTRLSLRYFKNIATLVSCVPLHLHNIVHSFDYQVLRIYFVVRHQCDFSKRNDLIQLIFGVL